MAIFACREGWIALVVAAGTCVVGLNHHGEASERRSNKYLLTVEETIGSLLILW